ncbi:hypothetical protein HOH45_00855 [bacterium]|nr:hypothetical protein [bacterium]
MSHPITLTLNDIKERVLHRFENLLVDEVENFRLDTPTESKINFCIKENDHLDRTLFFKQINPGEYTIFPQALMEILAIGCIVLSGANPKTSIVFYAGISNFKKYTHLSLNEKGTGQMILSSMKAGFMSSKVLIKNQKNDVITDAKIMAYIQSIDPNQTTNDSQPEKPKKKTDLLPVNCAEDVIKNTEYKKASMYMVDTINHISEQSVMGSYTFPKSHELTKGHFPGNPVFMGILQWLCLEDTLLGLLQILEKRNELNGTTWTITGSGTVCKENGTITTEIKNFVITAIRHPTYFSLDTIETKKITFKDIIRPDEPLKIIITNFILS